MQQSQQVAGGKGAPSMAPGGVIDEVGHMIVQNKAPETDLLEFAHDGDDIAVALIDEAFDEIIRAALYIPQMDVEKPSLATEVLYGFENTFSAAHLGPAAMA